jgi:hypothetical protein
VVDAISERDPQVSPPAIYFANTEYLSGESNNVGCVIGLQK